MDLTALKREILADRTGKFCMIDYLMGRGYARSEGESPAVARARAFCALVAESEKRVYDGDPVCGSMAGMFADREPDDYPLYRSYFDSYGDRGWLQGRDHYAPDYAHILRRGLPGLKRDVAESLKGRTGEEGETLKACALVLEGFSEMITGYARAAEGRARESLEKLLTNPPETFYEAVQLISMVRTAFLYQGLYAMALGRMDQYLCPYYLADRERGMSEREALDILDSLFVKIGEFRAYSDSDDVVNICIGGTDGRGNPAENELSLLILRAVGECSIPGPNLSARICKNTGDEFLMECLRLIGTGIGYPALMNDEVNVAALKRLGYREEDAFNYCMVGCIENFAAGRQPPWSDGRFDVPKYLEYTLNRGKCLLTGRGEGFDTGDPCKAPDMASFLGLFEDQLKKCAALYVLKVNNENRKIDQAFYQNPFLTALCPDAVSAGKDICGGGSFYPSVHGVGCMGIATVADSLAAIEKTVYLDRSLTMANLVEALRANFKGYERERSLLLCAPKYGNGDAFADKYAKWYVEALSDLFDGYRTADGGRFSVGIASNISNIDAGKNCGATADGRLAGEPVSDAASPSYGKDLSGVTSALTSLSRPDYTRTALGTVVNQKYSPEMFASDANLRRLASAIRVYFGRKGQELQINCVSRRVLEDAAEHPSLYGSLVVRVSGFSAYYVTLAPEVQQDILSRTEH